MDDLISRQAAIEAECAACSLNPPRERGHNCRHYVKGCPEIECLRNLPPAEQQRKKGKWTEKEVIHTDEAKEIITEWQSCKCSVCGRYHTQPYMYYFSEPRFCSWCGAEMVKGEEDDK